MVGPDWRCQLITNGPGVAVGKAVGVGNALGVGLAWLVALGCEDGLEIEAVIGLDPADSSETGLGEGELEQAPSNAAVHTTAVPTVNRPRVNRRDILCRPTATTPTLARSRPAYSVAPSRYSHSRRKLKSAPLSSHGGAPR